MASTEPGTAELGEQRGEWSPPSLAQPLSKTAPERDSSAYLQEDHVILWEE